MVSSLWKLPECLRDVVDFFRSEPKTPRRSPTKSLKLFPEKSLKQVVGDAGPGLTLPRIMKSVLTTKQNVGVNNN